MFSCDICWCTCGAFVKGATRIIGRLDSNSQKDCIKLLVDAYRKGNYYGLDSILFKPHSDDSSIEKVETSSLSFKTSRLCFRWLCWLIVYTKQKLPSSPKYARDYDFEHKVTKPEKGSYDMSLKLWKENKYSIDAQLTFEWWFHSEMSHKEIESVEWYMRMLIKMCSKSIASTSLLVAYYEKVGYSSHLLHFYNLLFLCDWTRNVLGDISKRLGGTLKIRIIRSRW